MKQKIIFQSKIKEDLLKFLELNKERKVLNFLNQHDLYQADKESIFRKSLLEKNNLNFIDGFVISAYFSLAKLRRVPRIRGPTFTKSFLSNKKISSGKKHFFIGIEKEDIENLKKKYPHLKDIQSYNPPYIKGLIFPEKEIEKITKMINKQEPDYIWVGVGCPKQNILSSELFNKTKAQYFVNIGAALDFRVGKKEEAPLIVRELGIEWLYRLITDFKYSKKKVWRSFLGVWKLNKITLAKNNSD